MLQALSRQRICSDLTQITHDAQNSSAMDHIDYASKIKPLDGCRFGVIRQATESGVSDAVLDSFWDSVNLIRELGVITFFQAENIPSFSSFLYEGAC